MMNSPLSAGKIAEAGAYDPAMNLAPAPMSAPNPPEVIEMEPEPLMLVRKEGPLVAGQTVSVDEDSLAVLIREGEVVGVLTSQSQNQADYSGALVFHVFTGVFEAMRFGGPVPLDHARGVLGAADIQVTDPVLLVTSMLEAGIGVDGLDVWLPDRIMVCVEEVLGQLAGRAKANAIMGGIVACTECMEEERGVIVRDIVRFRVLKND